MVLAYRGKSLISKIIRWHTRSQYSHVAIAIDGRIYEAWRGGVSHAATPWANHTENTHIDLFTVPGTTHEQALEAEAFLKSHIGDGYDFRMVSRFLSRLGPKPNDRWFCSELVCAALRQVGHHIVAEQVSCDEISPRDVTMSPVLELSERYLSADAWHHYARAAAGISHA